MSSNRAGSTKQKFIVVRTAFGSPSGIRTTTRGVRPVLSVSDSCYLIRLFRPRVPDRSHPFRTVPDLCVRTVRKHPLRFESNPARFYGAISTAGFLKRMFL